MTCAPSGDSDQPGHPPTQSFFMWTAKRRLWSDSLATNWVHSKDPSLTGQKPRLIRVTAGHTGHVVGFVVLWLIFCIGCDICNKWFHFKSRSRNHKWVISFKRKSEVELFILLLKVQAVWKTVKRISMYTAENIGKLTGYADDCSSRFELLGARDTNLKILDCQCHCLLILRNVLLCWLTNKTLLLLQANLSTQQQST